MPSLPAADHLVRVGAGLVGEEQRPARAEVVVRRVQGRLVERREGVGDRSARCHPHVAVAPVRAAVERPVAGDEVEAAGRVGCEPVTAHPYACVVRVRRQAHSERLLQGRRVVAEDPAVVRLEVAVAREAEVDDAVEQQERGVLVLAQRHERQWPPDDPCPCRERSPGSRRARRTSRRRWRGRARAADRVASSCRRRPPWSRRRRRACSCSWSITGVPVMPISGAMSQHSPVSPAGTVVMPFAGSMKLSFQSGVDERPSASNAYTLSCSVAT